MRERRKILNAFTVDLEEWFCSYALRSATPYEEWDRCESRITAPARRLLELLSRHGVEGTFFVLGWVAERHPDLIREIADRGHEIASHGYSHSLITEMSPSEFERDLERALEVIEKITGKRIDGYRAPCFTVTQRTLWALDLLRAAGLRYDSSVFPYGAHPDYGIADAPLVIYRHRNGLLEVPMSCAIVAGRRIPCGGGGYFRLMPYSLTKALIDRCHREGRGVIFYIHPWELDPTQPRMRLGAVESFRQYNNLESTERKLEHLLLDYTFTSIRTLLGSSSPAEESAPTVSDR